MHMCIHMHMQREAALFRALGCAARLRLLALLAQGERCVCELRPLVGLDASTTSRHLAILAAAGLVRCRRRGRKALYRLRPDGLARAEAGLAALRRGTR